MNFLRVGAGLALAVTLLACGGSEPIALPEELRPRRCNVVLLSVDTLRADHLGCYGYSRNTSPHLDALAGQSIRFANLYAPTPWTLPSHAAMLTGRHPFAIAMFDQGAQIPEDVSLVAEHFAAAGYQTAAFVDSPTHGFVGADRGFARGFELYRHAPFRPDLSRRYDMAETVDVALKWLDGRSSERPFFLFLHTFSVHAVPKGEACHDTFCFPYDKPEPYRFHFVSPSEASLPGQGQKYLWEVNRQILAGELAPSAFSGDHLAVLEALYDTGIYYTDHHIGRLVEGLRERGEFDRTAFMVTSDHGEAFLDHNLLMHQEVYEPLLRVPLIIHLPKGGDGLPPPAGEVSEVAVLADIAPTLLSLAGIALPEGLDGGPLLSENSPGQVLTRPGKPLLFYYLFPNLFTYRAFALRRGSLKLVVHNIDGPEQFRHELYDLATDPGEKSPLPLSHPGYPEMGQALCVAMDKSPTDESCLRGPVFSEELRALGYIE